MTLDEIKIRRLANQHLLSKTDCGSVVRDLCGVQAQYTSHAMHALKLRCSDFESFDRQALVRNWTLRGTIHLFSREDLPLFLHKGRKHPLRPCDTFDSDAYVSSQRKDFFAQLILDSVENGICEREDLRFFCRQNGMSDREELSIFDSWGGLLRALCESGRLCHGLQGKKSFCLCPEFEPTEDDAAHLELLRRYFTNFGPATLRDAAYFLGLTQSRIKVLIPNLPLIKTEVYGETYNHIETGREYSSEISDCIFLAGFDPLLLAYRKEDNPFLPAEHIRGIFSLSGIVHPAVLLRGKIVGRWKYESGKLVFTPFESLNQEDINIIKSSAGQMWPDMRRFDINTNVKI